MKTVHKKLILGAVLTILVLVFLAVWRTNALKQIEPSEHSQPELESIEWFSSFDENNRSISAQERQAVLKLGEVLNKKIDIEYGSISKLISRVSANDVPSVVSAPYNNPQINSLQRIGEFAVLNELLSKDILGQDVSMSDYKWQMDYRGNIYALVHGFSMLPKDMVEFEPSVILLAQKDIMARHGITQEDFGEKESLIEALKIIRKYEPYMTPCVLDLDTLVKMFGAREVDENGLWQDVFFSPQTLEAIRFLNTLYHEKLLPKTVYTFGKKQQSAEIESGNVFLLSGFQWKESIINYSESNKGNEYIAVSPIMPDSGVLMPFPSMQKSGSQATMFSKSADKEDILKIASFLYINDHEVSLEQELCLRKHPWYAQIKNIAPTVFSSHEDTLRRDKTYKNMVEPFTQQSYFVPPYDILFSYNSNSNIGNIDKNVEKYKQTQIEKMIFSADPNEVERLYDVTVSTIYSMKYDIVLQWKQKQYNKIGAD